jgi:hypothetical protein
VQDVAFNFQKVQPVLRPPLLWPCLLLLQLLLRQKSEQAGRLYMQEAFLPMKQLQQQQAWPEKRRTKNWLHFLEIKGHILHNTIYYNQFYLYV